MKTVVRAEVHRRQQITQRGQREDRVVSQESGAHAGPPGRLDGLVGSGNFESTGSAVDVR